MNRIFGLLILASLVGCASTGDESPPPQPVTTAKGTTNNQLKVQVDMQGNLTIAGYSLSERDLSQLVQQWHVTSAVVYGTLGSKFGDALNVQAALKACGVQDVTIVAAHNGD